jgi:hypothetical protein
MPAREIVRVNSRRRSRGSTRDGSLRSRSTFALSFRRCFGSYPTRPPRPHRTLQGRPPGCSAAFMRLFRGGPTGFREGLLSQPPGRSSAAVSRETRLGQASLEPNAHQRFRALVAEHPSSIHPRVSLAIDAATLTSLAADAHRGIASWDQERTRKAARTDHARAAWTCLVACSRSADLA